ncbi:MAG: hypothetical protein ACRDQ5_16955 [Sciscionella sp.]
MPSATAKNVTFCWTVRVRLGANPPLRMNPQGVHAAGDDLAALSASAKPRPSFVDEPTKKSVMNLLLTACHRWQPASKYT